MTRTWRSRRLVFALLSGVALGACESADPVAAPESTPGAPASFDAFEESVVAQAHASGIDPAAPARELPISRARGNREWVFVQGSMGDAAVEAVIGVQGGLLNLGNHWLLVPRNAVRGSVRFRMVPVNDGTFHVDLTATSVGRGTESENDVGQGGFRKPVYLAFHYGDPTRIDPASLHVAWLTNGALVVQETFIHEQEWAVGVLRHFSGYVLVAN
jgi:hypothetical protein